MKKFLIALLILPSLSWGQIERYVSKELGNDANPGTRELPWKSMARYNNPVITVTDTTWIIYLRGGEMYDSAFVPARSGFSPEHRIEWSVYDTAMSGPPVINIHGGNWTLGGFNWADPTSWNPARPGQDTLWYALTGRVRNVRVWGDTGTGYFELPYSSGPPRGGCPGFFLNCDPDGTGPRPPLTFFDAINTVHPILGTSGWQLGTSWTGQYGGLYAYPMRGTVWGDSVVIYSRHMNPALFYDSLRMNTRPWAMFPIQIGALRNIKISGLKTIGGQNAINMNGARLVEIANCNLRQNDRQTIYVLNSDSCYIHDNILDRVDTVQYSRDPSYGSAAGICFENADYNVITRNRSYNNKYEGILFQGSSAYNEITWNYFDGSRGDYSHLFGLEGTSNNNYFAHNTYHKMRCRAQIYSSNNVFEYETIDTVLFSPARYDVEAITGGIYIIGGLNNRFSNFFFNHTYGPSVGFEGTTSGNIFENFIVYNSARYAGSFVPASEGYHNYNIRNMAIWSRTPASLQNNIFRNWIVWNDTNQTNMVLSNNTYLATTVKYTAESFMAAYPTAATNIRFIDPMFVNPAAGDYRLQAGSPAIDAGYQNPDIRATVDAYNQTTPYNGARDIGTYEYRTYVPPLPPPIGNRKTIWRYGSRPTQPGTSYRTFTEDMDTFPNPERGFFYGFDQINPTTSNAQSYCNTAASRGSRLVIMYYRWSNYRTVPFSQAALDLMNYDLGVVRSNGMKCIFKIYYDSQPWPGMPPLATTINHMNQLAPIVQANADVIAFVEMGWLGPWGEWHTATEANKDAAGLIFQDSLINHWLRCLPEERAVQLRTVAFMQFHYGQTPLQDYQAYDGSTFSRIGFHNDAFISGSGWDDQGTWQKYPNPNGSTDSAITKGYLQQQSRWTPVGGEMDGTGRVTCGNALWEGESQHWSFLNGTFYIPALNLLRSGGCYDDYQRRLGYRFVLDSVRADSVIYIGQNWRFRGYLRNVGFAAPVSYRNPYIVLRRHGGTQEFRLQVLDDMRFWLPGRQYIDRTFNIPGGIFSPGDQVDAYLYFPDHHVSIASNPLYAIRLANTGVWNATLGYNDLGITLPIR